MIPWLSNWPFFRLRPKLTSSPFPGWCISLTIVPEARHGEVNAGWYLVYQYLILPTHVHTTVLDPRPKHHQLSREGILASTTYLDRVKISSFLSSPFFSSDSNHILRTGPNISMHHVTQHLPVGIPLQDAKRTNINFKMQNGRFQSQARDQTLRTNLATSHTICTQHRYDFHSVIRAPKNPTAAPTPTPILFQILPQVTQHIPAPRNLKVKCLYLRTKSILPSICAWKYSLRTRAQLPLLPISISKNGENVVERGDHHASSEQAKLPTSLPPSL